MKEIRILIILLFSCCKNITQNIPEGSNTSSASQELCSDDVDTCQKERICIMIEHGALCGDDFFDTEFKCVNNNYINNLFKNSSDKILYKNKDKKWMSIVDQKIDAGYKDEKTDMCGICKNKKRCFARYKLNENYKISDHPIDYGCYTPCKWVDDCDSDEFCDCHSSLYKDGIESRELHACVRRTYPIDRHAEPTMGR